MGTRHVRVELLLGSILGSSRLLLESLASRRLRTSSASSRGLQRLVLSSSVSAALLRATSLLVMTYGGIRG